VDAEVVRYNERYKTLGTFCDNAGLAVWAGSVAQFFDAEGSNFLTVFGVLLGLVFLVIGWHIRGLIQSEDQ
jgi:preprotein translocase subunit SecG